MSNIYIDSQNPVSPIQAVFVGMGVSSPLLGIVGDKYGRKVVSTFEIYCMLLSCITICINVHIYNSVT